MCRHLAYLGQPVDLATLLCEPPHSLLRQSFAPADMRDGGTVNADGFGVGWYQHGRDLPVRYRRAVPMWTDTAFASFAPGVHSSAVLAAVRSATVGMPVVETACAPFARARWLFSHNGIVTGWPGSVAGLAARLPVTDLLTLDAPTDSALLCALVHHRLQEGYGPAAALATVTAEVLDAAPGSRCTQLLTDGALIAGTAVHHSLWVRADDAGVLVASEPTDGALGWAPVPEGHLLFASPSAVQTRPIRSEEP